MSKPKLLDHVRSTIRFRHFSIRTEQTYIHWIKRFILFHKKRHPLEMGEEEIRQFLSYLATKENVASSTQNVALSALLFLYRHVLRQEMPFINGIERSKRPAKIRPWSWFRPVGKENHKDTKSTKGISFCSLWIFVSLWFSFPFHTFNWPKQ
jgi:hypothetical protein